MNIHTSNRLRSRAWRALLVASFAAPIFGLTYLVIKQKNEIEDLRARLEQTRDALGRLGSEANLRDARKIAKHKVNQEANAEEANTKKRIQDANRGNGNVVAISHARVESYGNSAPVPAELDARTLSFKALGQIERQYAGLIRQLGLSPEKTDKLFALLMDKKQSNVDLTSAGTTLQEYRAQIEGEIEDLLGPSGYQAYRNFTAVQAQAGVLNDLQSSLANTEQPLTDDQVKQLADVLAETGAKTIKSSLIRAAKDILLPPQMDALKQLQMEERGSQQAKRLQPTTSPTLPALGGASLAGNGKSGG